MQAASLHIQVRGTRMPDTLLANSSSSEEGAQVAEGGTSPNSPDSNSSPGGGDPMSQSTLTQQRSPLQPYSFNDHQGVPARASTAEQVASVVRQRWVVFNKARIQEIFEATLSKMTSEMNNTLVPGLQLPGDTNGNTHQDTSQNTTVSQNSDKQNVDSNRNTSTTKTSYSAKQGSVTKDTSVHAQKRDGEGKENNSNVSSPVWSSTGSEVSNEDLRPLTPISSQSGLVSQGSGGQLLRPEVSVSKCSTEGNHAVGNGGSIQHSGNAPGELTAVSAAVQNKVQQQAEHQHSVHQAQQQQAGGINTECSSSAITALSTEQHQQQQQHRAATTVVAAQSSASIRSPCSTNPTDCNYTTQPVAPTTAEPMVQWGLEGGIRVRSGSRESPGLAGDTQGVMDGTDPHKAPRSTEPPVDLASRSPTSTPPTPSDNPIPKKAAKASTATHRAKRGNGSKKVSGGTKCSDQVDNNDNQCGEKGKECWVKLNKAVVYDMFEVAMNQVDNQVSSSSSAASLVPPVPPPAHSGRRGSLTSDTSLHLPQPAHPRPPNELVSLLGDTEPQPPSAVKQAPKRAASMPLARSTAGTGNSPRGSTKRRRVVSTPQAPIPSACDSSRPWTVDDQTVPSQPQQPCGLDLRSEQTKSKDHHSSSSSSSSTLTSQQAQSHISSNVSVSSAVLSALLATNPDYGTSSMTATGTTASVMSPPPSPILIDEESDSGSSHYASIDSPIPEPLPTTQCTDKLDNNSNSQSCTDAVRERSSRPARRRGHASAQRTQRGPLPRERVRASAGQRASTPQIPIMEKQPVRRKARSASHESPKHGWVAVSKSDVHTIVDSVMTRMFHADEHPRTEYMMNTSTTTIMSMNPALPSSRTNIDSDQLSHEGFVMPPHCPPSHPSSSDSNISESTQGPLAPRDHHFPSSPTSTFTSPLVSATSSFTPSVVAPSAPAPEEKVKRLLSLPNPRLPASKPSQRRVSFASIDQLAKGSPPGSPRPLKWKSSLMLRAQAQGDPTSQDLPEEDCDDEYVYNRRKSCDSDTCSTQVENTPQPDS